MSTDVRLLNYCSDAIDDLRLAARTLRNTNPHTARHANIVADMLQDAVKFILPNCARLIDRFSIGESHLELLRLPYPIVAFEAPWDSDTETGSELNGYQQHKSSRRIALCWELDENFAPFPFLDQGEIHAVFPDGGVFIFPISYADHARSWLPGAGGCFVPRDFRTENIEVLPATHIAISALREAGRLSGKEYEFRAEPFVLMPVHFDEVVARGNFDVNRAIAQVSLDAHDEVITVIQACSVLNCSNVETADVRPTRAANAMRAAKGKRPFFTYKVLQVSADRSSGTEQGGGTHTSPRMHLRRGHLRRLPEKVVWVRASMVNAGSADGVVAKDYAVRPQSNVKG
jgi:hypothetical protein